MLKNLLGLAFSVTVLACSAFGYGNAGHETVGALAEYYLAGTPAAAKVREILRPTETLAKACTWADRAKLPEKYLSDEMKEFVTNNPDHRTFHYCDVPFQETSYQEGGTGTRPTDIVGTMNLCIGILLDPSPAPENPGRISKRVAFLMLVHLAGDIHQPLHVGCSYVDSENKFVNPDKGGKGQEDAGANYFKLTSQTALHGYWDTVAVKNARKRAGGEDYVAYLARTYPPRKEWKATGAVRTWPRQWANATLPLSKHCYEGLTLSERKTIPADEKRPAHDEWRVTLPAGYDERAATIVDRELGRAGYRLAEMLKAIWPK